MAVQIALGIVLAVILLIAIGITLLILLYIVIGVLSAIAAMVESVAPKRPNYTPDMDRHELAWPMTRLRSGKIVFDPLNRKK